jgi:hypothetical protein
MSKISHANWSVDFAMDDEHAKSRMKEVTNELASLFSSLNLGVKKCLLKKMCTWQDRNNMAELVDLAWGREIHLGLDGTSEEPVGVNNVDD